MNKGFTLIELLAVIVILAIISIIAVPIILNIITDVKIKATEQSVNGIIDSLKQQYTKINFKNGVKLPIYITYGDINLQYETDLENLVDISDEIKVDGTTPTEGVIILKEDGKVEFGYSDITINGYICTIDKDIVSCSNKKANKYTKESCFEFSGSSIKGYKDHCPKDVVIPPTITLEGKTYDVKIISSSAFSYKKLTSVDFSNLSELHTIQPYAFYSNKLKTVDLSKNINLETLYDGVFANNQIENYKLPPQNIVYKNGGAGIFTNNKLSDKDAFIYGRTSDGNIDKTVIISYGGANRNIVIPSEVEKIYDKAFMSVNIETIDFSKAKNLKYIGSQAFRYCDIDIEHLDLSNYTSLETIGFAAFERNSLKSVDLSGCTNLETIGSSAFDGNRGNYDASNRITSVNLSGCTSLESIGYSAFYGNSINQIDLSGCTNLKTIESSAFEFNNLKTLDFSELISLTTIGNSAFQYNDLTNIDLSNCNNLTTIEYGAFRKWKLLTYTTSNPGLTLIKTNGKEFDWNSIINGSGSSGTSFVTGVVENTAGNVTIE